MRRGKYESSQSMRRKKQSYDRFCMTASRRCQVVLSPDVGYLPEFVALKAQSTPHVPRPGPALGAVVFKRVPCVPRGREHWKRPQAGRKQKCRSTKKVNLVNGNMGVPTRVGLAIRCGTRVSQSRYPTKQTLSTLLDCLVRMMWRSALKRVFPFDLVGDVPT